MKLAKILFNTTGLVLSASIQAAWLLLAVVFIFGLSYVLGYRYLIGNTLIGNDIYSFYMVVQWIHQYFPSVPFWYSIAGGGISFEGYPWFAAYLVNVIDHFSSLDLAQSFRLLGFLSVPLTGIGIFLFSWTRLTDVKPTWMRQFIGLIAAGFYVVAPVSWLWLIRWGFYAEQVSLIFVPITLLFFDLYIDRLFAKKHDFISRLGLFGTMVFWILGFLTHFFAGVSLIVVFLALGIVKFISQKESKRLLAKRLVVPSILFVLIFSALFIFRYYSYTSYSNSVAEGGFTGPATAASDRKGVAASSLTARMTLSLEDPEDPINDWRFQIKDMRFPFYVWILIVPSLLFGFFKSKKIFTFAVLAALGFLINTDPDHLIFVSQIPIIKHIPVVNMLPGFLTGRIFFVASRIYIPLAAAYGAYIAWEIIGSSCIHFIKRIKVMYYVFLPIKVLIVLILMLLTVGVVVYKYYNLPYSRDTVNMGAFESILTNPKGKSQTIKIKLNDIWGRNARPEQILTAAYSDEQQSFLDAHPDYKKIADYIYLHYVCAFVGPDGVREENEEEEAIVKKDYPDGHICKFLVQEVSTKNSQQLSTDLFPPLDVLKEKQLYCANFSVESIKAEDTYCKAFNLPSFQDQVALKNWPKFSVSSNVSAGLKGTANLFDSLPKDREYRYDLSGFVGKSIMLASLVNNNSLIQTYIGSLNLIYNAWNYQSQMMYTQFPLYQSPGVLTELAKWFGLDYVFLAGPPMEPHSYWATDTNWRLLQNNQKTQRQLAIGEAGWQEFQMPTSLTTWDNRPRVLVISDNKKYFYDQTYRFFTQGGLLYDQAIPVQGKKEVDQYSYDELKNYDVIFMRGYEYKSRNGAYSLLDKYVRNGGNLIFDTGLQYYVPDWKLDRAPSFMPFDSLSWKELGSKARFVVEDKEILHDIDEQKLGDLSFENKSWGVSVPENLREWAHPLVAVDGKPLVVGGQYHRGKVVWLGFNIVPHAETKASQEEIKLFNQLLIFANDGFEEADKYSVAKKRLSPDLVEFSLNQTVDHPTNLYFREAFYKDWKASLISDGRKKSLLIRRAGPGFMLMLLPEVKSGDKVELRISKSFTQTVANLTSLVTFILLCLYLFFPKSLTFLKQYSFNFGIQNTVISKVHKHIKQKVTRISTNLQKSEDEDY